MPYYGPVRGLRTEVRQLIDPLTTSRSSSPGKRAEEFAYASAGLWSALLAQHSRRANFCIDHAEQEVLGVAAEWPEDKRLAEKGKRKATIVWVKRAADNSTENDGYVLEVPHHLLPRYPPTSIFATVHFHNLIDLSLAILQPIVQSADLSASTHLDVADLDVQSCYGSSDRKANGLANGYRSHEPARILRQDEIIHIPRKNGSPQALKVILLDPVHQGVLSPCTKVIASTTPLVIDDTETSWQDSDGVSESSYGGKTHLSLANFDPDTFLSSSLDLHLSQPSPLPDGSPTLDEVDMGQSISSSTSGSITPRPNGHVKELPPGSPPAQIGDVLPEEDAVIGGTRFTGVIAQGPLVNGSSRASSALDDGDDVCWMGVGGLGRAGIFEGDWVLVRPTKSLHDGAQDGRLVKACVWERLDEDDEELPAHPILLPPALHRSLAASESPTADVLVSPTSFGARRPSLPVAKTMTIARIATAEGVDKRYERSWLKALRTHFCGSRKGKERDAGDGARKLVRRGDIIAVPVHIDTPLSTDEQTEDSDSSDTEDEKSWTPSPRKKSPTALAYFLVTSLSFDPLVPLEEDFRSSTSSKARAGELGCWVDVGDEGSTRMVLTGVERGRVRQRSEDRIWNSLRAAPTPFNQKIFTRLRDLLKSCFSSIAIASALQLSILVKGARGAGKTSLLRHLADELGYNIVTIEAYDITGDTAARTEGSILAAIEKAASCSPAILLVMHIEALAKKTESGPTGRPPAIVKILEDALSSLQKASSETGFPCVLVGTTADADAVPGEVLGCFKQDIELGAPNEAERSIIAGNLLRDMPLASDVSLTSISAQSAALQAADIAALIRRAQDLALQRVMNAAQRSTRELRLAGLPISAADLEKALGDARASYSDSIGAPKIPNVRWEDVGGLANVKKEILETVQLPLQRPELFAEGLKKRSGILLYGPPGTGKTLLAKAVATSCSLNFFSVKGPELLNMYIGESEANVRRVFQRARDASPCIIFMDELDSVAPKRGNQGDSGGVMDRIVSQLLAELDGMGKSGQGSDVFVMGATNRPDLLDPALLRPGRFDRMLYLSVATTHAAQLSILQALTRKFNLAPDLDLEEVSEMCPFNYTGADFYALCSDAMLRAMTRKAEEVDARIEALNNSPPPHAFPSPLTPQYYLASMASKAEIEVKVAKEDFVLALEKLVPSVSRGEMEHYERVQKDFKAYNIGETPDGGGEVEGS